MKKLFCVNCTSYNVCKYAEKRAPDMCGYYLLRSRALKEIMRELERQNEKWGEQNHEMGSKHGKMKELADQMKAWNYHRPHSWYTILMEEVYEAFAEFKPEKQREEMIQVAAVVVQIIEYLDRRIEEEAQNENGD